jgi:hypothetical protein
MDQTSLLTPLLCALQVADRLPNALAVQVTAGEEGAAAHSKLVFLSILLTKHYNNTGCKPAAAGC